mmetsp:Transcript_155077/g.282058  ORF Transcript_155077/g.282058 Transcript_155077/m.282058 type:complete len:207 (-) Transcript_155077:52-672(-)
MGGPRGAVAYDDDTEIYWQDEYGDWHDTYWEQSEEWNDGWWSGVDSDDGESSYEDGDERDERCLDDEDDCEWSHSNEAESDDESEGTLPETTPRAARNAKLRHWYQQTVKRWDRLKRGSLEVEGPFGLRTLRTLLPRKHCFTNSLTRGAMPSGTLAHAHAEVTSCSDLRKGRQVPSRRLTRFLSTLKRSRSEGWGTQFCQLARSSA